MLQALFRRTNVRYTNIARLSSLCSLRPKALVLPPCLSTKRVSSATKTFAPAQVSLRHYTQDMGSPLFTVPIGTNGTVECTTVADKVYLLTFDSPPDNRLRTDFNAAMVLALDMILQRYHPIVTDGVVITTSKIPKFYSNGLDLEHVGQTPEFFPRSFWPLFRRLVTYPMPTIALVNGHAFAGGLIMSMYHDYRIMNPNKGFLCLNEVLFGAVMDPPLLGIFRDKVPPATFRRLVLEGHRFSGKEALSAGIVDELGDMETVLELVKSRDLTNKGKAGVYQQLKEEVYRHSIHLLDHHVENRAWRSYLSTQKEWEHAQASKAIEQFGKDGTVRNSKL